MQTYLEEAGYRRFVTTNDPLQAMELVAPAAPGLSAARPDDAGAVGLRHPGADARRRGAALHPGDHLTAASDTDDQAEGARAGGDRIPVQAGRPERADGCAAQHAGLQGLPGPSGEPDPLTGLPNQRVFAEQLQAAAGAAPRQAACRAGAAAHRPGPVQADQRHPRPPRRRSTAGGGGAALACARCRRGRWPTTLLLTPPGRRRVRAC